MTVPASLRPRFLACLPLLALALAGCATVPARLPVGSSRGQALQQLGQPTATYPMPGGGERLQYSRQPSGYQVNNVDLDSGGHVVAIVQALDDPVFNSPIVVGKWREADVLRAYGKPYQVTRVTSFDGPVWSWQFMDLSTPRLFYVFFDPDGDVAPFFAGVNPNILNVY